MPVTWCADSVSHPFSLPSNATQRYTALCRPSPTPQRYNVDGQGSIEFDEFREALQLESDPVLVKGFMAYAQGSMTNL